MPTKPNKAERQKKVKSRSLNEFYAEYYGERWPRLRAALSQTPRKVALWNRYCQLSVQNVLPLLNEMELTPCGLELCSDNSNNNRASSDTIETDKSTDVCNDMAERTSCDENNHFCNKNNNFDNFANTRENKKLCLYGTSNVTSIRTQEQSEHNSSYALSEQQEYEEEEEQVQSTLISQPTVDAFNIKSHYILDLASVVVVHELQIGAFDSVLDLCAAPGGKSIAIAQLLSPSATLTCNERKPDRINRLRRTLKDYLPLNYVQWKLTERDGCRWYDPRRFSRVLVDAPCSSERHLILQCGGNAERVSLREWSEQSSLTLAREVQVELLLRAIETCRKDGLVVYSTCSLSPYENDDVITSALQKTKCHVTVVSNRTHWQCCITSKCKVSNMKDESSVNNGVVNNNENEEFNSQTMELGEPTLHGTIILPDVANGWGPIYYCVLRKERKVQKNEEDQNCSSDDEDETSSSSDSSSSSSDGSNTSWNDDYN